MSELYFLRHGQRIDHAPAGSKSLATEYQSYDPSLSRDAEAQIEELTSEILDITRAFSDKCTSRRKNIFVHFSPYLRCCQTADLIVSELKLLLPEKYPDFNVKYQLLCDFALSEWIHDKMKNKPPFVDSNEAYQMYTPNLKLLKNRSNCSNFRPTTTLGPYNGPDLSYRDYQSRCKDYFKRLLATYEKGSYIENRDIIIVVSHGYAINNFLSYFISHPIFDEIPEAKINLARRVHYSEADDDESMESSENNEDEDDDEEEEEFDQEDYTWKLVKDAMNMADGSLDTTLNLETDIVYYKTNFIKRDELATEMANSSSRQTTTAVVKPRASFKIENDTKKPRNPICLAAKNWDVTTANKFKIRAEFQLKHMNDESFRKDFDLNKRPSKPVSPEISPNSEPTRNNSLVDLSKLLSNEEIYKPFKTKYSNAFEIPIHKLNSKVNSQVNLAQYQREYHSSNDGSYIDLAKLSANAKASRKMSDSNPLQIASPPVPADSYFTLGMHTSSQASLSSLSSVNDDHVQTKPPRELKGSPPVIGSPPDSISRARSLNYKKKLANGKSVFYRHQGHHDSDESDDGLANRVSLAFGNSLRRQNSQKDRDRRGKKKADVSRPQTESPQPAGRSRKNSIKFIPSVLSYEKVNSPSLVAQNGNTTSQVPKRTNVQPMFFALDSDSHTDMSDLDGSDIERMDFLDSGSKPKKKNSNNDDTHDNKEQYLWFGQNRR